MFASFFFAGFEGATGYNKHRQWIDQVAATHHDLHADEDYRRLREVGIYAAREAIRWPVVNRGGRYDFSSVKPFIDASRKHRIEVIWDLFHYGYPDDIDPFAAEFPERFAAYCRAAAKYVSREHHGRCYFTPVNEPSFFSWAAGEVGQFAPHQLGRGRELKIALVRAAIQGIDAIRSVVPDARFVNVDPICLVVAPPGRPELASLAHQYNEVFVFEAWDMLCGRLMPELGGSRDHLDIVGINYYWTNQWELGREREPLALDDPRLVPFRELVRRVWERYGGDLLITETTHLNEMRPVWLQHVAEEAQALVREGVPLRGVCLYPILGMPEWHAQDEWVPLGLWDLVPRETILCRELCQPMHQVLREAQSQLGHW